jgi:hypothetical protein
VKKPLVITPEEASGRMLIAIEDLADSARGLMESLDIISAYVQKKGINEGVFTKEEFEEGKE